MRIVVLVPSRGRPDRARDMYRSAMDRARGTAGGVEVRVIVDADDPTLADYVNHELPLTGSLNLVAAELWDTVDVLGVAEPLLEDGVPSGTTSCSGSMIWSQPSVPNAADARDRVRQRPRPRSGASDRGVHVERHREGYLAIPQSRHLWVDDAWKLLGQKTDTLRYVPELIVEHMHPAVGKADMDLTYREVYDAELGHKDHLGFLDWEAHHADADAAKVRAVVHA